MIHLSARLRAAASMVRGGGVLADIGTDHAFLPVYLVQKGLVPRVIASDIGEGPLQNAKNTVESYGLTDLIELRLSDGLQNYTEGEVNEIVICGMGGNLIEEILSAAPWIKTDNMHLVLQPMTHVEDVRRYLCENGFEIEKELAIEDSGRIYLQISAFWSNANAVKDVGYYYFGELLHQPGLPQVIVKKQLDRVKTRVNALKTVNRNDEERAMLERVLAYYLKENAG